MKTTYFSGAASLLALAVFYSMTLVVAGAATEKKVQAVADIVACSDPAISGSAVLIEKPSEEGVKEVEITLRVDGLSDGKHAVHIHETASCVPCGSAGGHFDPGLYGFTSPDGNHPYHTGDLINIESKGGKAILKALSTRITLSPGPLSLFDADGSAFIVHDNSDSYCPDGNVAGCAGGSRAACGTIQLLE